MLIRAERSSYGGVEHSRHENLHAELSSNGRLGQGLLISPCGDQLLPSPYDLYGNAKV